MNDTPREIELGRLIAKIHRKEIKYGDWIAWDDDIPMIASCNMAPRKDLTPLWTIKDCLKWLKERYDDVNVGSINEEWEVQVHDAYDKVHHPEYLEDMTGKTPLEACLETVLAVCGYEDELLS